MKILAYLNYLDENKQYHRSDELEKQLLAANNFMFKKIKRQTPQQQMMDKLNEISTQINTLQDESGDSDSSETKIVLDNSEVEFKQQ